VNKYERKLLNHKKESRHNKLWIGMYAEKDNKYEKTKSLSYRTKADRDRLKLEREVDVWERSSTTQGL
jgi:hypothetical protein